MKNIRDIGKGIYKNNPFIQPFVDAVRNKEPYVPKFSGWGMTTEHEYPWNDQYQGNEFRRASKDVKEEIEFVDKEERGFENKARIDLLLWRHWNISYATKFCLEFADTKEYNFVECGVAEGITSFFILSELESRTDWIDNSTLFLYDSWGKMKPELLVESEKDFEGRYEGLDIQRTKKNLSKFKTKINFNKGYLPESLTLDNTPSDICFLHIDLNSSKVTHDVLEFFYPSLVKGGVMIFDDYGHQGYEDTKLIIDEFFHLKSGLLQKMPTGQAIYYKN